MKKKWWIILIVAVVFIWILFLLQHFLFYKYGCQWECEDEPYRWWVCENVNFRAKCSFRIFITDDSVSEKIFLWFWIDTRSLKEKPQKAPRIITDDDGNEIYIWEK